MCASRRFLLGLALCLALSVPCFSQSVDPHSLPPFDVSRTYQVPGATLEAFRLGLITLDEQLQTADSQLSQALEQLKGLQDSFTAYRRKTLLMEAGMGAAIVVLTICLLTK